MLPLFGNAHVRSLLAVLDDVEDEMRSALCSLRPIRHDLRKFFRANARSVREEIHKGRSPRSLVANTALNFILEAIEHREHHLFPGILSMEGDMLAAAFRWLVDDRQKAGELAVNDATQAYTRLRQAIQDPL